MDVADATEQMLTLLSSSKTNEEFLANLSGWTRLYEKGYTLIKKQPRRPLNPPPAKRLAQAYGVRRRFLAFARRCDGASRK